MYNEKGQAFSTFKLLIAAVVAIAMLTILLPIINQIGGIGQTNPNDEAARQINGVGPGEHRLTRSVNFSQETTLNARTIAAGSDKYSEDQVCVTKGEFDDTIFEEVEGRTVQYKGTGAQAVKLSIICDRGDLMQRAFEDNGLEETLGESRTFCSGLEDKTGCSEGSKQTCCIVMIRKT